MFSGGRHSSAGLPRTADARAAFPGFYCARGGFDVLALDPDEHPQDADVLAAAKRMAAHNAFELREVRLPPGFRTRVFRICR
jgi:hypothetical protein